MVFNIARPNVGDLALELIKQLDRVFTKNVNQHVQTPAMRHADTDFFCAVSADPLNGLGKHWDQTLTPLETEALGPRILGSKGAL